MAIFRESAAYTETTAKSQTTQRGGAGSCDLREDNIVGRLKTGAGVFCLGEQAGLTVFCPGLQCQ